MIVRFVQSGGFAGLVKGCELDTRSLPQEKAKELEAMIESSSISTPGKFLSHSSRDLNQYEITIKAGTSTISAVFDDETIPGSAKPLIGYLKKCAKPEKPQ